LTHGNIIGTNVLIHYHDNVPIQFNDVSIRNDQNDVFIEELINVYALVVYNPKRCLFVVIESLLVKKNKEPSHPLLCFFIFSIF